MKTDFFYDIIRNPELTKSFLNDLLVALSITPDQRATLIGVLPEIIGKTLTSKQREDYAKRFAEQCGLEKLEAKSALQALNFIASQLAEESYSDDSIEDLRVDLIVCLKENDIDYSEENINVFGCILENLKKDTIPAYKQIKKRKKTATGILPSINSFSHTVELRAVIDSSFHIGMSANEYKPKLTDFVPVVSIFISVDSGVADELAFQASEDELEALIQELKAAKIDMSTIKQYLESREKNNRF